MSTQRAYSKEFRLLIFSALFQGLSFFFRNPLRQSVSAALLPYALSEQYHCRNPPDPQHLAAASKFHSAGIIPRSGERVLRVIRHTDFTLILDSSLFPSG